jgi:alpha,alpha-trehalase
MNFFFIEDLSPLYEEVQLSGIFPDSKFFVDAVPRFPAHEITNAYSKEKTKPGFDLRSFLEQQFILPPERENYYHSDNKPIEPHLQELWDVLKRTPDQQGGTLIPLPCPYIVPGGRFREIYYWDSYFTMLGLQVSGRLDMVENMVNNFASLIRQVGFIPNGNRTYYLGRSQPPFFALMLELLSTHKGSETLIEYGPLLLKEYHFWMDGSEGLLPGKAEGHVLKMKDGTILNRFWDHKDKPRPEAYMEDLHIAARSGRNPKEVYRHIRAAAESGWDFSSRWFRNPADMSSIHTSDIIPVDLNCLLLHMEELLAQISALRGDPLELIWNQRATQRKKAIEKYCWHPEKGFFFDYDFILEAHTPCYTLAGITPLFFNIASSDQAARVASLIQEKFLQPGGVVTTLEKTGQQWDAPNGWAPLQWMTCKGLRQYGFHELAESIRNNWMHLNEQVYATTGKMMEKYNVMDTSLAAGGGEYPNQDGFGWTNGVYLQFLKMM